MDKYLFFKGMNARTEFNYLSCSKILSIEYLPRRRIMTDLKLMARSWMGQIDTESFIHHLNINVPMRRTADTFRLHRSRINVGKNSVFNRIMSNCDKYCMEAHENFKKLQTR
jgi:hypothetical protein